MLSVYEHVEDCVDYSTWQRQQLVDDRGRFLTRQLSCIFPNDVGCTVLRCPANKTSRDYASEDFPHSNFIAHFIGVNIREQKSGTERTKKRKKLELVLFTPLGGATGTVVHRLDAKRILPELP